MSRPFWLALALVGLAINAPSLLPAWPALVPLGACGVLLGRAWRRESPCPQPPLALLFWVSAALLLLVCGLLLPTGPLRAVLDRGEPPISFVGNLGMLVWAWPDEPLRRARRRWQDSVVRLRLNRAIPRGP